MCLEGRMGGLVVRPEVRLRTVSLLSCYSRPVTAPLRTHHASRVQVLETALKRYT